MVEIKKTLFEISSSDNITIVKDKIREEVKNGIDKERILNKSDSILIKKFIDKIIQELNNPY